MSYKIRNLDSVFNPASIAVIGASRDPSKIGHVIVKNFIDGGYAGKIYPINPNAEDILGLSSYKSVLGINGKVESAVICVPAAIVPKVLEECGQKGVKGIVLITSGFSEIGNHNEEKKIIEISEKYEMALIGPNCMGVLVPSSKVDSIFLPIYKLGRPRVGRISFVSQSGAVGGCVVDLAALAGVGLSKFVSYGNGASIDACDLIEYFSQDKQTDIIVAYLEGVNDGKRLLEVMKNTTKKKPIIVLKAGKSQAGADAARSHTGSLAGSSEAYSAAFLQSHAIEAHTLEDLINFTRIFDQMLPVGNRIGIITNGGGMGVLATDALSEQNLLLSSFSEKTAKLIHNSLPSYTTIRNPLDLTGTANSHSYEIAVNALMEDEAVDIIVVIILFQTAAIDSGVVNIIIRASDQKKKPILVVSLGGGYTDMHRKILDSYGVPTFGSPSACMRALGHFVAYARHYRKFNSKISKKLSDPLYSSK